MTNNRTDPMYELIKQRDQLDTALGDCAERLAQLEAENQLLRGLLAEARATVASFFPPSKEVGKGIAQRLRDIADADELKDVEP